MIANYSPPIFTLQQSLRPRQNRTVPRNLVTVLGPQYLLALADGRDLPDYSFQAAGQLLDFKYIEDGQLHTLDTATHEPDAESVRLVAEDLQAEYADNVTAWKTDPLGTNYLRLTNGTLNGGAVNTGFEDRQVQINDVFFIEVDNKDAAWAAKDDDFMRRVTGLLNRRTASSAEAPVAAGTNFPAQATDVAEFVGAAGAYTGVTPTTVAGTTDEAIAAVGGSYDGKLGDEFILEVTNADDPDNPEFSVYSVARNITVADVAAPRDTGDNNLDLPLTGHYAGLSVELVRSPSAPVVGEKIRVGFKTAWTPANPFSLTSTTAYVGDIDRTYLVEVTGGGSGADREVRIYDAEGIETPALASLDLNGNASITVGLGSHGLELTVVAGDLAYGDVYVVAATASRDVPGEYDGVVLDGPAYDPAPGVFDGGSFRVSARLPFSGYLDSTNSSTGDNPVEIVSGQVSYESDLGVDGPLAEFFKFVNDQGRVAVEFRAVRLVGQTEGPVTITDPLQATELLGEGHEQNDLCQGVLAALEGTAAAGQSLAVVAVRTNGPSVADFNEALTKLTNSDRYYCMVPMTDDLDVKLAVRDHMENQSSKTSKNFRQMFCGTDSPGRQVWWGARPNGAFLRAKLDADVVTLHEDDRDYNFVTDLVRAGDLVKFSAEGEFEILEVFSNGYEVRVRNPGNTAIATASAFTLIKPDTADNTADLVIRTSRRLSSARAHNVWSDRPLGPDSESLTVLAARYLAAFEAGKRMGTAPQLGLSNSPVRYVLEAPGMYTRFTPDILNRMASNGVWIVSQEVEGGPVFTRHQLTTDTDNGMIGYESHATFVRDTYTFTKKDALSGMVGRFNVTDQTIANIESRLINISVRAASFADVDEGPLIQYFTDENGVEGQVTVRRDGDLADKILTYTRIGIAMPLNDLEGHVESEAALLL